MNKLYFIIFKIYNLSNIALENWVYTNLFYLLSITVLLYRIYGNFLNIDNSYFCAKELYFLFKRKLHANTDNRNCLRTEVITCFVTEKLTRMSNIIKRGKTIEENNNYFECNLDANNERIMKNVTQNIWQRLKLFGLVC